MNTEDTVHLGDHGRDNWDMYMEREREQLAQRATGKMARMIGRVLPGESEEELKIIASDDQYLASQGYVPLRKGQKVWHKHIDELTPEDSPARLTYERTLVGWLKRRLKAQQEGGIG